MNRRQSLVALATTGLVCVCRRAHADERPERRCGFHSAGGVLAVSVSLEDLFVAADEERLRSGFATRVLLRIEVMRESPSGVQVIAIAARQTEIAYDLWEEKYRVLVWDGGQPQPRAFEAKDGRAAIRLSTALIRFPVVYLSQLNASDRHRLRLRADLNPLSEEAVGEARRWLVRPPGQGRASGDSVFGSFVSIFVNPRIEESERQISFMSQSFVRGALR